MGIEKFGNFWLHSSCYFSAYTMLKPFDCKSKRLVAEYEFNIWLYLIGQKAKDTSSLNGTQSLDKSLKLQENSS